MGVLGNLFGKKNKKSKRPEDPLRPGHRPPPVASDGSPMSAEELLPEMDSMTAKQLARKLGSANPNIRHAVEKRLGELQAHSAIRPLISAYLMNGDEPALEALSGYGAALTLPMNDLANDLTNTGERRSRIMDILGQTGDDAVLPAVRGGVEDDDPAVRARACAALVKLGDLHGIGRLDQDLQTNDPVAKRLALHTLIEMDRPEAKKCIEEHIGRYLAESDAIPKQTTVHAPRLDDPKIHLHDAIISSIKAADHTLTLVVGGEAINYATARRSTFEEGLEGMVVRFGTRRMVPEEQIAELEAARDDAAAGKRSVFVGMVPSPAADPPVPHFLKPVDGGQDYTARMIIADPHEFSAAQAWWYYVLDMGAVPTDIDIFMNVSRPGTSAISEEEYEIYELLDSDDKKHEFMRALLARL